MATLSAAPRIRLAGEAELAEMRAVDRAAGEQFRAIGMAAIADEDPMSLADLRHFQAAGRAWVIDEPREAEEPGIVAFLLAEPVDERLHIAQVSVHPGAARRGLGRTLISYVGGLAQAGRLSLTTYERVPWNAPYYRRLGFRELPEREWGSGLSAIRAGERQAGLDRWPRLAMVRENNPHG
jgi:GNAT superfamily N-acetyltransferase